MPIRIGSTEISDIRAGNTPVNEVRVGNILVWSRANAPVLSAITNRTVNYNASVRISVIATGTAPITYSATGLPSGITINTSTGLISGRSTRSGSHTITVTARNAGGSASRTFTLTIRTQSVTPTPSGPPRFSQSSYTLNYGAGSGGFTDSLTVFDVGSSPSASASGAPSFVTITGNAGGVTMRFTHGVQRSGTYSFTVSFSASNGSTSASVTMNFN